jgi:hypothetical protein
MLASLFRERPGDIAGRNDTTRRNDAHSHPTCARAVRLERIPQQFVSRGFEIMNSRTSSQPRAALNSGPSSSRQPMQ